MDPIVATILFFKKKLWSSLYVLVFKLGAHVGLVKILIKHEDEPWKTRKNGKTFFLRKKHSIGRSFYPIVTKHGIYIRSMNNTDQVSKTNYMDSIGETKLSLLVSLQLLPNLVQIRT